MQDKLFPSFQMHKKEHDMFIEKIAAMLTEFLGGKRSLLLDMFCFVTNLLSLHIPMSDTEIGRFIAAKTTGKSQEIRRNEANA